MPSNTTNLALYKKNPATDGADTFNIDTMLNENWDKLDALPGTATPVVDGTAAVGVSKKYAREDHKHPTDTTRLAASAYTAADVLVKLKTVDGAGSGLDADTVKGYAPWGDNTTAQRSTITARQTASQSFASPGTLTKVTLDTVNMDNLVEFSSSRFTAKFAGLYQINAMIMFAVGATPSLIIADIFVNGGESVRLAQYLAGASQNQIVNGGFTLRLVAGDYIELYASTSQAISTVANYSLMSITRIA